MLRKKFDEARLKTGQRKAAEALLEREFGDARDRKTKEQIAESIGVSRMTLYRWEHEDENFIAYYNHLAQKYADSQLAFVYAQLMKGIKSGSMKGIELYLKQAGKLIDKQEIAVEDSREDAEERRKRLEERLKQVKDDQEN